jgi:hypothetical protein
MVLLGKIALTLTGTMLAGVGVICSEGMVEVNVVEKSPEIHHVYVVAPAMLAPIAVHFIPADKLGNASEQIKPYLPEIRAGLEQLRETDDFVHHRTTGRQAQRRKNYAVVLDDRWYE